MDNIKKYSRRKETELPKNINKGKTLTNELNPSLKIKLDDKINNDSLLLRNYSNNDGSLDYNGVLKNHQDTNLKK